MFDLIFLKAQTLIYHFSVIINNKLLINICKIIMSAYEGETPNFFSNSLHKSTSKSMNVIRTDYGIYLRIHL